MIEAKAGFTTGPSFDLVNGTAWGTINDLAHLHDPCRPPTAFMSPKTAPVACPHWGRFANVANVPRSDTAPIG
jgi:hypothetical protein